MSDRQDLIEVIKEAQYQLEQMRLCLYNGEEIRPIKGKHIHSFRKNIIVLLKKSEIEYAIQRIEEDDKR